MAGMSGKARARQSGISRLVKGEPEKGVTASVDAVAAAIAGAAIDPAAAHIPAAEVVPAPPAAAAPDEGTVLPDETLVALPDAPLPIVTASPPLAAEPDALDVVEQQRAMRDGVRPGDPRQPAEPVVAGQTMLTIEPDALGEAIDRDAVRHRDEFVRRDRNAIDDVAIGVGADSLTRELTAFRDRDPVGFSRLQAELSGGPTDSGRNASIRVVEVVGPPQGRRRGGFAFGPTPRRFLSTTLTEEQLDAMRSDPLLAVGISEVDRNADVLREFGA